MRKRVRLARRKRDAVRDERDVAAVVIGDVEHDLRIRAERQRPAHARGVERHGELQAVADLQRLRREA